MTKKVYNLATISNHTNDSPENEEKKETRMMVEMNTKDTQANYETAISLCSFGRFNYTLIFICGITFLFAGSQSAINSYIIPAAECDLQLTSERKGFLNSAFLIGGIFSAFFWGFIANVYGRKRNIIVALVLDGLFTVMSSLSQTYYILGIFRFTSGFLIGGPGSLIYTYLGEFHSSKQRIRSMCCVGLFWTAATLFLPGLGWLIMPLKININISGLILNSWRIYLGSIGLPLFIMGLVIIFLPESPKYLLSRGRSKEALEILEKIYSINTGHLTSSYPVKELIASIDEVNEKNNNNNSNRVIVNLLKDAWYQIKNLTTPPLIKYALLCWTIYFTNMFGWYGLGIWMPELFNRFQNYYLLHPNSTNESVCKLVSINETITKIVNNSYNCEEYRINEKVFGHTLIINFASVMGIILCGYLSTRVGRRTIPVVTLFISGLSGMTLYFVNSSTQILIVASIFSMALNAANVVCNSMIVDIFPTYVNALALCINSFFGRLGAIASNLAFGTLVDSHCDLLIFIVAAVIIVGAVLSLLLPSAKTKIISSN